MGKRLDLSTALLHVLLGGSIGCVFVFVFVYCETEESRWIGKLGLCFLCKLICMVV